MSGSTGAVHSIVADVNGAPARIRRITYAAEAVDGVEKHPADDAFAAMPTTLPPEWVWPSTVVATAPPLKNASPSSGHPSADVSGSVIVKLIDVPTVTPR